MTNIGMVGIAWALSLAFLKLTLEQKILSGGKKPITAEFVFASSTMGDIRIG
jgi:hypothetical protein